LRLAKMEGAQLAASFPVDLENGLMLVTDTGQVIRVPVDGIRIAGRATAGVTIIRLRGDEKVVSVQRVIEAEDEEAIDGSDDAAPVEDASSAE